MVYQAADKTLLKGAAVTQANAAPTLAIDFPNPAQRLPNPTKCCPKTGKILANATQACQPLANVKSG